MHVSMSSTVLYALPAPMATWVANAVRCHPGQSFCTENLLGRHVSLLAGSTDEDYPILCPPGQFGNSTDALTQLSSQCSGACPPGSFCNHAMGLVDFDYGSDWRRDRRSGSIEPVVCRKGTYCQAGSPSEVPCPEGWYGEFQELKSKDSCTLCPQGFWCRGGEKNPCPVRTFNPSNGSASQDACELCPPDSTTDSVGAVFEEACKCVADFYLFDPLVDGERVCDTEGRCDGIGRCTGTGRRCCACPIGTDCTGGQTLSTLYTKPGFYRPTNRTQDVWQCPDAETGCDALAGVCNATNSGCRGGSDPSSQCADTLRPDGVLYPRRGSNYMSAAHRC